MEIETLSFASQAESLQEQVDEVTRELQLGKKGVDAAENALQVRSCAEHLQSCEGCCHLKGSMQIMQPCTSLCKEVPSNLQIFK